MSLKITSTGGFVIGKVPNPTEVIFLRANVNMNKQEFVYFTDVDKKNDVEFIAIETTANTTLLGGLKDQYIQIKGITPLYYPLYSPLVEDMNVLYAEVEEYLKAKILADNPTWTIEIVNLNE